MRGLEILYGVLCRDHGFVIWNPTEMRTSQRYAYKKVSLKLEKNSKRKRKKINERCRRKMGGERKRTRT